MVKGVYSLKGDADYKGPSVKDRYKPQKRKPGRDRPEGDFQILRDVGNRTGVVLPAKVEERLVAGEFDASPKMVPFSKDPAYLLSRIEGLMLSPQQLYFAVGPEQFIWISAGNASGKTFAGAVFVYMQVICNPKTLGLIAANSYAQLNQSTLKPLFEFLDKMGMPYCINKIPPPEWGLSRIMPDYDGVMVFPTGAHILLRSLDRPANLEGLCFGIDTPVQMFDGSICFIQHLQVGDVLMGPEGMPRLVTQTSEGHGNLWWIIPKSPGFSEDGSPIAREAEGADKKRGPDKMKGGRIKRGAGYICNSQHILVLHNESTGQTINISLEDYQAAPDPNLKYVYQDGSTVDFEIESYGQGDYYGLLIDSPPGLGDASHRFLLVDGTVVHNTIGWFWVDETRYTRSKTYNVIVNRLRCPKSVWRVGRVTSTPDGHNWLYKLFVQGMEHKNPKISLNYRIIYMSTRENHHLPDGFLEIIENQWDEMIAPQEIDGRIIRIQVGRSYHAYSDVHNCKDRHPYDPNLPLVMCWDFNGSIQPMALVLAQEHFNQRKNCIEVQVVDEIVKQYSNTEEICTIFKQKYLGHQGGLHIYGDCDHATSSKSDYAIIKEHLEPVFPGYVNFNVGRANPKHIDRTNSVNGMLCNNKRLRRLYIHPKCKVLRNDLVMVKPEANRKNQIDKKSDAQLTHTSDALGYYITAKFPVLRQDVRNFLAPQSQLYITS